MGCSKRVEFRAAEQSRNSSPKMSGKKELKNLLIAVGVAAAITYIIFGIVLCVAVVKGQSMEPEYKEGDVLLLYRLGDYKRNDAVLVKNSGEGYIKRVVGLPDEAVNFKDGNVIIDNAVLEESYATGETEPKEGSIYPIRLALDEYFVLGDQREHSIDSRSFGAVKDGDIEGKVIAVLRIQKEI